MILDRPAAPRTSSQPTLTTSKQRKTSVNMSNQLFSSNTVVTESGRKCIFISSEAASVPDFSTMESKLAIRVRKSQCSASRSSPLPPTCAGHVADVMVFFIPLSQQQYIRHSYAAAVWHERLRKIKWGSGKKCSQIYKYDRLSGLNYSQIISAMW